MKRAEAFKRCTQAILTAQMSQRYHSSYSSWWGWIDRLVRIAVGVLATAGVVVTLASESLASWLAITVSLSSLLAAIVLNVVPVGDWEKQHLDLFRRWSTLRRRIESLQLAIRKSDSETIKNETVDLLDELNREASFISADEPDPNDKLLRKCQNKTRESMLGDESVKLDDWLRLHYPDLFEGEPESPTNPHAAAVTAGSS